MSPTSCHRKKEAPAIFPLLTSRDVAELFSLKEKTLADWRAQGIGPPYICIGRTIRYSPGDIEGYLAENAGGQQKRANSDVKRSVKGRDRGKPVKTAKSHSKKTKAAGLLSVPDKEKKKRRLKS